MAATWRRLPEPGSEPGSSGARCRSAARCATCVGRGQAAGPPRGGAAPGTIARGHGVRRRPPAQPEPRHPHAHRGPQRRHAAAPRLLHHPRRHPLLHHAGRYPHHLRPQVPAGPPQLAHGADAAVPPPRHPRRHQPRRRHRRAQGGGRQQPEQSRREAVGGGRRAVRDGHLTGRPPALLRHFPDFFPPVLFFFFVCVYFFFFHHVAFSSHTPAPFPKLVLRNNAWKSRVVFFFCFVFVLAAGLPQKISAAVVPEEVPAPPMLPLRVGKSLLGSRFDPDSSRAPRFHRATQRGRALRAALGFTINIYIFWY